MGTGGNVPQRISGNASSRHTAFADASAARAGGPHFGARSGQPGAMDLIKVKKVIARLEVTPISRWLIVLVATLVGAGIAFLIFLRQLHRTFSRRGCEQLDSLGPLLGPTHPLWPAEEMRALRRR
jgi:hypothetical protein